MLAKGVQLIDGSSRGKQQLVKDDCLFESDLGIEGQVEDGRAATGDEKENKRVLTGFAQEGQRGARSGEGVLVRERMAAFEVTDAPVADRWYLVGAADAAQAFAALHAIEQHLEHGASCFADGNDEDAPVSRKIDDVGTAAIGHEPAELVALETQAVVKG